VCVSGGGGGGSSRLISICWWWWWWWCKCEEEVWMQGGGSRTPRDQAVPAGVCLGGGGGVKRGKGREAEGGGRAATSLNHHTH